MDEWMNGWEGCAVLGNLAVATTLVNIVMMI